MGAFKRHRHRVLCCRLCEKRAGLPKRYLRPVEKRRWLKDAS